MHWASCSTICCRWRDARNRADAISKRFVSRTRPQRIQPFIERWRLIIQGKVQGVGFRASCNRRALDLGLRGWVRNRKDGSLEVQAEGAPMAIAELRPGVSRAHRVLRC